MTNELNAVDQTCWNLIASAGLPARITLDVPASLAAQLSPLADRCGCSIQDLCRQVLTEYAANPNASNLTERIREHSKTMGAPVTQIDQTNFVTTATPHVFMDSVSLQFYFCDETTEAHGPYATERRAAIAARAMQLGLEGRA